MHLELHQCLVRAGALASTEGAEHRGRRAGREAVHASGTLSSEARGLLPFDRLKIFWSAPNRFKNTPMIVRSARRTETGARRGPRQVPFCRLGRAAVSALGPPCTPRSPAPAARACCHLPRACASSASLASALLLSTLARRPRLGRS